MARSPSRVSSTTACLRSKCKATIRPAPGCAAAAVAAGGAARCRRRSRGGRAGDVRGVRGAQLSAATAVTDAAGQAETLVRLQDAGGVTGVIAGAPGVADPVTFYVRAVASRSRISRNSGRPAISRSAGKGPSHRAKGRAADGRGVDPAIPPESRRTACPTARRIRRRSTSSLTRTALRMRGRQLCDGFLPARTGRAGGQPLAGGRLHRRRRGGASPPLRRRSRTGWRRARPCCFRWHCR